VAFASDISLVEFDFVRNQELDEFIPETDLLMMLLLSGDVLPDWSASVSLASFDTSGTFD